MTNLLKNWAKAILVSTTVATLAVVIAISTALHFGWLVRPDSFASNDEKIIDAIESVESDLQEMESAEENSDEAPSAVVTVEVPTSLDPDADERPVLGPLGELANISSLAKLSPERLDDSQPLGVFDRDAVLADHSSRIGDDFSIPADMKDRVGFWFDVYTKYDSNQRIIHHGLFPWIIYKVVDVSPIINAEKPRFRWMRNQKADNYVKQEREKIRHAVMTLSKRKNFEDLNEYEQMVSSALGGLEGELKKNARKAVRELRVQTGQRNFFVSALEISPRYLGTMEQIFAAKRLPTELTRIPFVESSFNKQATSKVGASGIWQFMGNTGRKFMTVTDVIDERRSPFKATEAAARLLKENHLILHKKWPLAITAWNHGPGGVRRASQRAGSKEIGTIVQRYRSRNFDFASSNFYAEFLAALHAEKYADEVFGPINRSEPAELHVVKLPRNFRVKDLIEITGMTMEDFLLINPDLTRVARRNLVVPAGFRVLFPIAALDGIQRYLADGGTKSRKRTSG